MISSAILNSYADYRCTLVPRLPFPVPRSPFPVPGISNTHFLRKPRRDFRLQTSDFRLPTSDFRLPTSDFRLPTSDFRLPTSDFRLPTSDFRLPTSDFRLQTSDFRLPTSDFRLPTSDFRLQTLHKRHPSETASDLDFRTHMLYFVPPPYFLPFLPLKPSQIHWTTFVQLCFGK